MSKHTPGPWRVGDAGHAVFGAPGSGLYPNAPICVVKGRQLSLDNKYQ